VSVRERLLAAAVRAGLVVSDATLDAWQAAVERVEAGLADRDGEPAHLAVVEAAADAPGVPRDALDDGPWVWRAEPPVPATGTGPLDGWALAVKDLIAVADRPIRAGSRARAAAPPEPADAPPVARLRAAGAQLVGTTKLHEFAFGVTGVNTVDRTAANPAAPGRVPGGSSSGSAAAVARGEARLALGTDTGGSCRIPAACCGVVGMKPSFGLVPTAGTFPLSPTLDHIGWFTASVADARLAARALGVPVPLDGGGAAGSTARRWGVARVGLDGADDVVAAAFATLEEAAGRAGVTLVDVPWPGGEEVFATSTAIMFAEAAHVHRASLAAAGPAYGPDIAARLVQGGAIDVATYLAAREARDELRARCLGALADADVAAVLLPTVLAAPPRLEDVADPTVGARMVTNTRLANVTGLPAVSVPWAPTALPVGIQVEAADDATALAVAEAVERLAHGAED
jgi:Asp-tRNA(Asn)/Glu-tRNA(Gln) amidotransferase A subunit family amidase